MRPLQKYVGLQLLFEASVAQFGTNPNTQEETILLVDVKETTFGGTEFSHVWCYATKRFNKNVLKRGEKVLFEAMVRPYRKGKNKLKIDYGLDRPKKIKSLGQDKRFNPIQRLKPSKRIPINELKKQK